MRPMGSISMPRKSMLRDTKRSSNSRVRPRRSSQNTSKRISVGLISAGAGIVDDDDTPSHRAVEAVCQQKLTEL